MKSVIAIEPGHLEIIDTPVPKPGPYQALVRTERACICNRTDSGLLLCRLSQAIREDEYIAQNQPYYAIHGVSNRINLRADHSTVTERKPYLLQLCPNCQ